MNLTRKNNIRLFARNEGKIKSYKSCCDVRAWSHDVGDQDRYLREWMKSDMTISVFPARVLAGCLITMTCKSRRMAAPRCHPDCRSKVLLDSICSSCHAVKECLKGDDNFEKYFVEEELETSHWPCDRCLEALKSIKMFWKIIVDKILKLSMPKFEDFTAKCDCSDSIRSVAKVWQAEIVQQSVFVKNISPGFCRTSSFVKSKCPNVEVLKKVCSQRRINSSPVKVSDCQKCLRSSKSYIIRSKDTNIPLTKSLNKLTASTSIGIRTVDVGCDTCYFDKGNEKCKAYKKSIEYLQDKCNCQEIEMERLRRENNTLRIELENIYKSCPWKPCFYAPDCKEIDNPSITIIPQPFESHLDDGCSPKNIDSEMIITMKNCKNQNFKHVSLLQVLHKTNVPTEEDIHRPTCKKEDPIAILTKVQKTFGAIVKREMNIINERKCRPKTTDVNASFHRVHCSRSAPSCSTLSSKCNSEQEYMSTKELCDRKCIKITNF